MAGTIGVEDTEGEMEKKKDLKKEEKKFCTLIYRNISSKVISC